MHFAHGVYLFVSELVLATKRVKGKGKVHPRTDLATLRVGVEVFNLVTRWGGW